MKSHKNKEGIPPVIMDKELNIIDGFHRLGTLIQLPI